jgi:hypothetical protein
MGATTVRPMSEQTLQKELDTYHSKLPELLVSIGKFVLIKDRQIEGLYDTPMP